MSRINRALPGLLIAVGLLSQSDAGGAEVTHQSARGFQVSIELPIEAEPGAVYEAFIEDVGQWWEPAHTYSGDSGNLSLDAKAGGSFLERLPDGGSVEHLRVVFVQPGKSIRLTGGLGPLQSLAVSGSLTCTFTSLDQGGCRLTWVYNVAGETADGLDSWAKPVDGVLRAQAEGLKRLVEGRE